MNISLKIHEHAQEIPYKVAVKDTTGVLTYAQLEQQVNSLAYALKSMGLKWDEGVSILLSNRKEFVVALMGSIRAGGIATSIRCQLKISEIIHLIKTSQSKIVILEEGVLQYIQAIKENIPEIIAFIVVGREYPECYFFDALIEANKNQELVISENEYAICCSTSGTTGLPKGALYTHKSWESGFEILRKSCGMTKEDVAICVLPGSHMFPLGYSIMTPLYQGATVVMVEKFEPHKVLKAVKENKGTTLAGVPSLYQAILVEIEGNYEGELDTLEKLYVGGAPLPECVYVDYKEKYKLELIELLGMTEVPLVAINPKNKRKPGSIGVAGLWTEIEIRDEDYKAVPLGEVGEMCVKTKCKLSKYTLTSEKDSNIFVEDWLATGDLAYMDEDGYVFIAGRKKDLIIVSGQNVFPREVEEVIAAMPKVQECAVIGMPDNLRGEIPVAFVATKKGQVLTEKEVVLYCRKYLANYKCPRKVLFIEEMPKNTVGKMNKLALKSYL